MANPGCGCSRQSTEGGQVSELANSSNPKLNWAPPVGSSKSDTGITHYRIVTASEGSTGYFINNNGQVAPSHFVQVPQESKELPHMVGLSSQRPQRLLQQHRRKQQQRLRELHHCLHDNKANFPLVKEGSADKLRNYLGQEIWVHPGIQSRQHCREGNTCPNPSCQNPVGGSSISYPLRRCSCSSTGEPWVGIQRSADKHRLLYDSKHLNLIPLPSAEQICEHADSGVLDANLYPERQKLRNYFVPRRSVPTLQRCTDPNLVRDYKGNICYPPEPRRAKLDGVAQSTDRLRASTMITMAGLPQQMRLECYEDCGGKPLKDCKPKAPRPPDPSCPFPRNKRPNLSYDNVPTSRVYRPPPQDLKRHRLIEIDPCEDLCCYIPPC